MIYKFLLMSVVVSVIYTLFKLNYDNPLQNLLVVIGVFIVVFFQSILLGFPVYWLLDYYKLLSLIPIIISAVLIAVIPWLLIFYFSNTDFISVQVGQDIVIENGKRTDLWWKHKLKELIIIGVAGGLGGLVFFYLTNIKK